MKLYIMRHGTTIWNEKGIIQGRSNNKLSTAGLALTQEAAKNFSGTKIDVIFCSPVLRTMQTANIINKFHNVKIIKDERLAEIGQGVFEKRKKSSLTPHEIQIRLRRDPAYGMESYESVFTRVKEFYLNLIKNKPFENILVITHNTPATLLEKAILNKKPNFNDPNSLRGFKNAEIKLFDIK